MSAAHRIRGPAVNRLGTLLLAIGAVPALGICVSLFIGMDVDADLSRRGLPPRSIICGGSAQYVVGNVRAFCEQYAGLDLLLRGSIVALLLGAVIPAGAFSIAKICGM